MTGDLGQAGLAAGGVIAGAAIPGPAGILAAGAFAIVGGLLYEPKRVDAQRPNIQFPVGSPGRVVPRILGTDMAESVGYDFFGNVRFREQTEDVGKGSQEVTTGFQVLCDLGCTVCMGVGDILQIYREGVLIYDTQSGGVTQALTGVLRLYRGTLDQLPDPVEQALFGIDNVSGYPEIIRFTLQNHDISDINRAPTFKVLVARAAVPNYPVDDLGINQSFREGAKLDDNTYVFISGSTFSVWNLATATRLSSENAGVDAYFNVPWGVDFDGHLYGAVDQPGVNSKYFQWLAPDYSSTIAGPFVDGGSGGGCLVTNTPLATTRDQQILFGCNGRRLNAWRLTVLNGWPGTALYLQVLLSGPTIFDNPISSTGLAPMTRDPVTGNMILVAPAGDLLSFYVGAWSPLTGAMVMGNGGTINIPRLAGASGRINDICYVPQTGEFAVLTGGDSGVPAVVYFLDGEDLTLTQAWATGSVIEVVDKMVNLWGWGPDPKGRIFVTLSGTQERFFQEWDLVQRQVLQTYDALNWGMPGQNQTAGSIVFDYQRRAVFYHDNIGGSSKILSLDRKTGQGTDLASFTQELLDLTALDGATDFNGTDVASVALKGGRFEDGTIAQFLKGFYDFHQCRYISSQFQIRAFRRTATPVLTIPKMHLGAAELGGVAPLLTRPSDRPLGLPQSSEVAYRRTTDYQNDQQEHSRDPAAVVSRDPTRLVYLGPLDDDEAKAGAIRRLDEIHLRERSFQSTLPPWYLNLEPGDCVAVEDGSETRICETAEASPTLIGVINWVGVRADDRALTRSGDGAPSSVPPQSLQPLVPSVPVILDTPLLLESLEAATPILHLSVRQDTIEAPRTALIQRSPQGAELWADYASIEGSRIMQSGILKAPLAAGPTGVFDLTNTIHCTLDRGSLASAPDQATVLADETINAYAIEVDNPPENGGRFQLGQFVAAAQQSDRSYILSQLYRGRRDTDNQVAGGSSQGKRIYFLALGQMAVKVIPYSDVGQLWDYRAFTVGANVASQIVTRETVGDSKRPYRGIALAGQLLTPANTWEVIWGSRSRFSQSGSMEAPPLSEPLDFEVDMLDGPEGSPVANATITTSASPNGSVITVDTSPARQQKVSIAAQDQVDWFGSVQPTVHLAVYHIADVGRGHPLYVSYTGVPAT